MEKHYQQYLLFTKCLEIVDKYATRSTKYELTKNVIRISNDARVIGPGAKDVLRKSMQQGLIISRIILPSVSKKFSQEIVDLLYSSTELEKEGKLVIKKEKDGTVFTYKDFTQKLGDCHYDQWSKHSDDKTIASILMEFSNMIALRDGLIENYPSETLKNVFQSIKHKAKKYYELITFATLSVASKIDKDFQLRSIEPDIQKEFGVTHSINNFKYDDNCIIMIQLYVTKLVLYAILDKIMLENKDHKNMTIIIYTRTKSSEELKYFTNFEKILISFSERSSYKNIECHVGTLIGVSESVTFFTNNPEIAKILQKHVDNNNNN